MQDQPRAGSNRIEKMIVLGLLLVIVLLYAFFLKDILIPFLKLEIRHDLDGAQELLRSRPQPRKIQLSGPEPDPVPLKGIPDNAAAHIIGIFLFAAGKHFT